MAKMTTVQKLAQAVAMAAKYEAELAADFIRNNIEAGDVINFSHGRADTKKDLVGTVVGVKSDTNGTWVAVTVGEGFELETYKIRAASITGNPAADARSAAPAVVEEAAPVDESDPLNNV